jgi:hypothetical protein
VPELFLILFPLCLDDLEDGCGQKGIVDVVDLSLDRVRRRVRYEPAIDEIRNEPRIEDDPELRAFLAQP